MQEQVKAYKMGQIAHIVNRPLSMGDAIDWQTALGQTAMGGPYGQAVGGMNINYSHNASPSFSYTASAMSKTG